MELNYFAVSQYRKHSHIEVTGVSTEKQHRRFQPLDGFQTLILHFSKSMILLSFHLSYIKVIRHCEERSNPAT
jgi:hypothetical protein